MMTRSQPRWAVAALLLLLPAPQGRCASPIPAMRHEDPRLEQRVTLTSSRIYMGDLLERLAAKTGVAVAADAGDGAADEQVTVFLKDVPLAEAMDALWALMGYQESTWLWDRSGKPGRFRYRLERPPAAQRLAERLTQEVYGKLEEDARVVLPAARMTPDQLQMAAEHDPRIANMLHFPRVQAGLATFAAVLSPEQQLAVLRGQTHIRVPVSQLPEQGRKFVHDLWEATASHAVHATSEGLVEPIPEPAWVEFGTMRSPGGTAPTFMIMMPDIGGYGYIGGAPLDRIWRQKIADMWLLVGDATDDLTAARPAPRPKAEPVFSRWNTPRQIRAFRLKQLAEVVPLSLMARLPRSEDDPEAPFGPTARAFLERLQQEGPRLQVKWRDHILLLTYPGWFHPEERAGQVPWAVAKQLRGMEDRAGGALSLQDLAWAANRLSDLQLSQLGEDEFPAMTNVARWRELFLLMGRSPALASHLLSPAGVPLDAVLPAIRPRLDVGSIVDQGKLAFVRVVQKTLTPAESQSFSVDLKLLGLPPSTRRIDVEVVSRQGTVLARQGFMYGSRKREAEPVAGSVEQRPALN